MLILQILRKDIRHLAPFLLALLALQTVFAIGTIHSVGLVDPENRLEATLGFIETLLFVCWALLIALVVLEDPLVDENAFGLTRPYSWRSLLAAKILFVFAFLNLPLFISDCAILKSVGLPIDISPILLRQLPLVALVIIPVFAFAAISRRLSQFWLLLVITLAAMAVLSFSATEKFGYKIHLVKCPDTLALLTVSLCAIPAIFIQFARRPHIITRIWFVALFVIAIPAVLITTHLMQDEAFFIQRHPASTQDTRWQQVQFDFETDPAQAPNPPVLKSSDWIGLRIPLRVRGLPAGVVLGGEGETFLGAWPKPLHSSLVHDKDGYAIDISFHGPVNTGAEIPIRSSLQVWIFNNAPAYEKVLRQSELRNIPNVGLCQVSALNHNELVCWRGPLRPPSLAIATKSWTHSFSKEPNSFVLDDDTPVTDELVWDLSPIEKRALRFEKSEQFISGATVTFIPHFVMGSFHRDLRTAHFPLSNASPGFLFSTTPTRAPEL